MTQVPPDAQLSPDGHYWWDSESNAWQAVPGGAADTGAGNDPAQSQPQDAGQDAGQTGGGHNGDLTIEIGQVTEVTHSHDEVVAMLDQAGTSLPKGEAYA